MNRKRKVKVTQYERIARAELARAYTGGLKEHLMFQAELVIEKMLKSFGPNARGEFRIRVAFWPDGWQNRDPE